MNPVLYIFVNKGLDMSGGKIAAQVAQATAGILCENLNPLCKEWWTGPGYHHAVYVMHADDNEHMYTIERYLHDRGFKTFMMIDEGMTEIRPITPTAMAVDIVDKDDEHVAATFSVFKLYKDKPAPPRNASNVTKRSRARSWFNPS